MEGKEVGNHRLFFVISIVVRILHGCVVSHTLSDKVVESESSICG